jgi:hypothetical protein
MDVDTDHSALQNSRPIADIAEAACHLAGHWDVRAVHVVSSQRPTYDELLRVHRCASECGVELHVDACGVSFHRSATPVSRSDAPAVLRWLRAHGKTWQAGLTALSEGTR